MRFILATMLFAFSFSSLLQADDWKGIEAGGGTACRYSDTRVQCWGDNQYGQAIDLDVFNQVKFVGVGWEHSCVIDADGTWCFGKNDQGQIIPTPIENPKKLVLGAVHACALGDNGVTCWGSNTHGQSDVPEDLPYPIDIEAGNRQTCAVTKDELFCWGKLDFPGGKSFPISVKRVQEISMASGGHHGCVRDSSGIQCWGDQRHDRLIPPRSHRFPDRLILGGGHTCAIKDGKLKCWGYNVYGQASVPSTVVDPIDVAAGRYFTCALMKEKTLCWGILRREFE